MKVKGAIHKLYLTICLFLHIAYYIALHCTFFVRTIYHLLIKIRPTLIQMADYTLHLGIKLTMSTTFFIYFHSYLKL